VPPLFPDVFNAARLTAWEGLLVLGLPLIGRLLLRLLRAVRARHGARARNS
jgi:hypothetical protein